MVILDTLSMFHEWRRCSCKFAKIETPNINFQCFDIQYGRQLVHKVVAMVTIYQISKWSGNKWQLNDCTANLMYSCSVQWVFIKSALREIFSNSWLSLMCCSIYGLIVRLLYPCVNVLLPCIEIVCRLYLVSSIRQLNRCRNCAVVL